MRVFKRPALWAIALVLTLAIGGTPSQPVFAQEVPADPLHCGPIHVFEGDLVSLNVGNVGRPPQTPGVLQLRLLDPDGNPLLERSVTLAPGQSRSASLRLPRGGLVRGEIVPVSGPDDLRVRGTMQVQVPTRPRGLTYGPNVDCSGPTGNRGPV